MKKMFFLVSLAFISYSCVSTKSTIKNIDNNVPTPILHNNAFILREISTDNKYGYDKRYPINVYYNGTRNETINQQRFLNALAGPNGQEISYKKLESCCPFPTEHSSMGVGLLDVYEVKWDGQKKQIILYFNIYEKGKLMAPVGFTLKK